MSTKPETPAVGLLRVRDLRVAFKPPRGPQKEVVHGLDLDLALGRALAIVGESGSGKSVSVRGMLGLLPSNARVSGSAQLTVAGKSTEMIGASPDTMRAIRGRAVGMVFQNAMSALNPSMTLERQLTEHLLWHKICGRKEARERAVEALGDVGIPEPKRRVKMYPFQLSGGMRQRAMIASATIMEPDLIIADEPTTALDVTVQRQILDLLARLRAERGMGLILVTHDLGVARHLCDDAIVLRHGEVHERANLADLITKPRSDYAKLLVDASLEVGHGGALSELVTTTADADGDSDDILTANNLKMVFNGAGGSVVAVDGVSLKLPRRSTLGIVGESGSGKSTLARMVMRLIEPTEGQITFEGEDLLGLRGETLRRRRRDLQMVFQDPYGSLLPHFTVAANIAEPLRINSIGSASSRRERALELLAQVDLDKSMGDRYPRQLSGGQQQRVAIARALALEPEVLVCDEPTSSLDASVQIQVLSLLKELQDKFGFSVILITHNLAVVEQMADHVMVMRAGKVVEAGSVRQIFGSPQKPYTQELLGAVLPVRLPA